MREPEDKGERIDFIIGICAMVIFMSFFTLVEHLKSTNDAVAIFLVIIATMSVTKGKI